jgi:glycosyltransferase involved in cell wall biosynthesis
MKNVLLSAFVCEPNKGSEAGNGWNWAYYLSKKGFEVHVITTSLGKAAIEKALSEKNITNLHFHYVDHTDFWGKAFYWNVATMYTAYLLWQRKIYTLAKKLHQAKHFDVVQHVTWGSVKMGSMLYKLKATRFIYGPVGGGHNAPPKFKKYFFYEWKREWLRTKIGSVFSLVNPLTRPTLSNAYVVLATNSETFDYAMANGAKNIDLFMDSALPIDFIPTSYPEKNNNITQFVWVGGMWAFKGIALVLESFAKLSPDIRSQLHLKIIGDGPFMSQLRELVTQHNVSDIVTICGALPYDTVKKEYNNADVFIYCSLRDSCPAQYLEALAYGLPIITLNMNGAKNFLTDKVSLLVSVNEPETTVDEITEAIVKLTTDKTIRLEMSKNAYGFAQKNTWDVKIDYIVNKYYN